MTLGIAATVALALGIIGVYGVISYTVSPRTREMGIRIALGARAANIKRMILWQGARLTGVGLSVGLVAALGLTRLMEALLFGVTAADWLTYGAVGVALGAVALLASYLPAHKAGKVDPMVAMLVE